MYTDNFILPRYFYIRATEIRANDYFMLQVFRDIDLPIICSMRYVHTNDDAMIKIGEVAISSPGVVICTLITIVCSINLHYVILVGNVRVDMRRIN